MELAGIVVPARHVGLEVEGESAFRELLAEDPFAQRARETGGGDDPGMAGPAEGPDGVPQGRHPVKSAERQSLVHCRPPADDGGRSCGRKYRATGFDAS